MPLSKSLRIPDNSIEVIRKLKDASEEEVNQLADSLDEYTIYSVEDIAESDDFNIKLENGIDSNGFLLLMYNAAFSAHSNNISSARLAEDFAKQTQTKYPGDDLSGLEAKLFSILRKFDLSLRARTFSEAGGNQVQSISISTNERNVMNSDRKIEGVVINYDLVFEFLSGKDEKSYSFSLSQETMSGLAELIDEVSKNKEVILSSKGDMPRFKYFGEE